MLGDGGVYAAKKRKKPAQKIVKPSVVESPAKTNPSKRHRNRLNEELERLTSLLPFSQEVKGRLDKLSVLRLSVGYLKVKSYFNATLQKSAWTAPALSTSDGVSFSESDLLLQALNGFVLVVTTDGWVFYMSSSIQEYLGFHQSDVIHQSVYDLIHVEDRDMFRCQLHLTLNPNQAEAAFPAGGGRPDARATSGPDASVSFLPRHILPENSSFLEHTFCCRLRCLHDNSSGFLPLNFEGRLKYVDVGGQMQLALFAIASPLSPPSVMEIRTKTIVFQTKHKMDFAPTSIDTRGRVVLGYSEVELVTKGSGYEFIHAADMMYCADIHLKMIKTGESGLTVFRLLSKPGVWIWVQAHARVVFKDRKPDFIVVREKVLTNNEGEEHLRQRRLQLPFNFVTGEALLYGSCPSLESLSFPAPPGSSPPAPTQTPRETSLDPGSLLGSLLKQDRSVYTRSQEPRPSDPAWDPHLSLERAFTDSHALLSVPGEIQDLQRARPGGLTALAMLDSLGEILGEMGDGGRLEGLDVQETELRDWESALLRINVEMEEFSRQRSDLLANDVFSYVEEALRKENNI
ncbi:aryl hydrocarbon receptor-like [Osmerus eperlanus]|uniref:aryl hydrocarbon receptor-like n=1 Tax=Osmerus eperlanus TaxID=29151 RepID=UPI002E15BAFB